MHTNDRMFISFEIFQFENPALFMFSCTVDKVELVKIEEETKTEKKLSVIPRNIKYLFLNCKKL